MANILTLDGRAVFLAVLFGALMLVFGQRYGVFFLAVILLFLALSAFVTNVGRVKKRRLGVYEKSRGWRNVAANGIVPLALVAGFWLFGDPANRAIFIILYVAAVAGTAADKFASELGVLDGIPRSIINFRQVKKGVSGGVTAVGMLASLIGALMISLSVISLGFGYYYIAVVAVSGFVGAAVDSVAGHFEEKGIGNKFTSNILCAIAAALIAFVLVIL